MPLTGATAGPFRIMDGVDQAECDEITARLRGDCRNSVAVVQRGPHATGHERAACRGSQSRLGGRAGASAGGSRGGLRGRGGRGPDAAGRVQPRGGGPGPVRRPGHAGSSRRPRPDANAGHSAGCTAERAWASLPWSRWPGRARWARCLRGTAEHGPWFALVVEDVEKPPEHGDVRLGGRRWSWIWSWPRSTGWPHACRGAAFVDLVGFAPSVAMQGGPAPGPSCWPASPRRAQLPAGSHSRRWSARWAAIDCCEPRPESTPVSRNRGASRP